MRAFMNLPLLLSTLLLCLLHTTQGVCCDYYFNQEQSNNLRITIYTTAWCPYCKKAKSFLDGLKVNYTNCDIEQSALALKQYRELQGSGIPMIIINGTRIDGFDPIKIEQTIKSNL